MARKGRTKSENSWSTENRTDFTSHNSGNTKFILSIIITLRLCQN